MASVSLIADASLLSVFIAGAFLLPVFIAGASLLPVLCCCFLRCRCFAAAIFFAAGASLLLIPLLLCFRCFAVVFAQRVTLGS
jgi:hypothetical protein